MFDKDDIIKSTEIFQSIYSVAKTIGMDENKCLVYANNAALKYTDFDILDAMGLKNKFPINNKIEDSQVKNIEDTILLEDKQLNIKEQTFYRVTMLARAYGITFKECNAYLKDIGYQKLVGPYGTWVPTEKAKGLYRYKTVVVTSGYRNKKKTVDKLFWSESVMLGSKYSKVLPLAEYGESVIVE